MKSRKFWLAAAAMAAATVALFTGFLGGAEWITAVSILTAFYGASNVIEKRQNGGAK